MANPGDEKTDVFCAGILASIVRNGAVLFKSLRFHHFQLPSTTINRCKAPALGEVQDLIGEKAVFFPWEGQETALHLCCQRCHGRAVLGAITQVRPSALTTPTDEAERIVSCGEHHQEYVKRHDFSIEAQLSAYAI